jgi:hypothetical protein
VAVEVAVAVKVDNVTVAVKVCEGMAEAVVVAELVAVGEAVGV